MRQIAVSLTWWKSLPSPEVDGSGRRQHCSERNDLPLCTLHLPAAPFDQGGREGERCEAAECR
jgi:hypothetical protein